jgi:hypothetical protein
VLRFFFFYFLLISCALAQTPRITEILPVNTAGILDEDQTFQGWVEIWNPAPPSTSSPFGVFTLSGYKLSNGTTTWAFPTATALQMMPDERLIVWVSGKNRSVVTAPLHTNFTLPAGGGTVQLLNAANSAVSQIAYPAMAANVSYGRDEWDLAPTPTQVGTYNTPTPGDRNNFSGPGVAGKVNFSITSGAYTASTITVTLTQANPEAGAVIRYTGNGTVPTAASQIYTVPLVFSGTTMLRARVFKTGLLPGETESHCYLQLDSSTSAFSSPMPIMVVTSFGVAIPNDGDLGGFAWMWEPAAPDNRARFTNPPTFASRIAMDKRGSSTLNNPKYNTNFEVRKARDDDDRNVSILGMAEGSDFVLGGPYEFDRSEVHNPFIYNLSRSIRRYAPDTRLMEVFFDVTGGTLNAPGFSSNDYYGIYNFMEKIRRDKNRVNVTNLRPYDNDVVGKTGGYIYKVDRQDTGDTGFGAGGQTMAYYDPKEIEAKSPQRDLQEQYLTSYINSFNNALQGGNFRDPVLGYAPFLDVPAAIDHHLLNTWSMNVDALRLSGYWFKERGGKLVPGPIWDFDRALESTDGRDDVPTAWRGTSDATDFFNYTWWNRLFFDPDFYQKYIDRWQELRRGPFSEATVNALLDSLNSKIAAEAVTRDISRWGKTKRTNTFPNSPSPSYDGTQAGEIKRIKEWLQVRANFMDSQWVGPVTASLPESNVAVGTQVTLTGPAGVPIYYTLNGGDPRPSGGGAPPGGVLTYSGPITINATTRIKARAFKLAHTALIGQNNPSLVSRWGGITDVRYATEPPATPSSITITEINYHPADASPAELAINPVFADSDFEFIEIKNRSAVPLDLGGVKISFATDFTFSGANAITIGPGEFAILAANPTAFTARYGAKPNLVGPFPGDLDNGGERIELRSAPSAGNAVILDFSFNDTWYPTTDGQGRTLAVYNPGASPAAFGNALNWRASAAVGGSPGADEPNLAPTLTPGSTIVGYLPSMVINATVTDDTQPSNTVTVGWSKLGGPGPVDFAPADASATQASFELPGVYSLRLSASDTALTAQSDFTIQMRDTPGAWVLRHPGIGTLNDDPDGDGRTNFFVWALSLPPLRGAGGDGSIVASEGDHLTLTYTRQKASPFVSYKVQVTSNPGAWADPQLGDVTEAILVDDGITQTVKVTDNTLMSSQAARFIRLKVSPLP